MANRLSVPYAELAAVTGRLEEVVQRGNPDTGWKGDPYLSVRYNHQTEMLQIYDTVFSPPKLVMQKPYDGVAALDTRSLTRALKEAAHDENDADTIWNRIERYNQAREDQLAAQRLAYGREQAEVLTWINRKLDW